MIVDKDTHPERKIYYLGALVLEILNNNSKNDSDFLEVFQQLKERAKVSMNLFTLTLDWLFLLGAIDTNRGRIEKCF